MWVTERQMEEFLEKEIEATKTQMMAKILDILARDRRLWSNFVSIGRKMTKVLVEKDF